MSDTGTHLIQGMSLLHTQNANLLVSSLFVQLSNDCVEVLLILDSHNIIMWAVAVRLVKIDARPIQSKNYYI